MKINIYINMKGLTMDELFADITFDHFILFERYKLIMRLDKTKHWEGVIRNQTIHW